MTSFGWTASRARTRLPYSLKVVLKNLVRNEDGRLVTAEHARAGHTGPHRPAQHKDPVHPGAGPHAGLHRGAMRGGPGRDG